MVLDKFSSGRVSGTTTEEVVAVAAATEAVTDALPRPTTAGEGAATKGPGPAPTLPVSMTATEPASRKTGCLQLRETGIGGDFEFGGRIGGWSDYEV